MRVQPKAPPKEPSKERRLIRVKFQHEFMVDLDEVIAERDYSEITEISEEEILDALIQRMYDEESYGSVDTQNQYDIYELLLWIGKIRNSEDLNPLDMELDLSVVTLNKQE